MAGVAINFVVLGVSGLLSIPALTNFFAVPTPEKITVNIGIGALNSSATLPSGLTTTGGNGPVVALYDVNGNQLGKAASGALSTEGGTVQVIFGGGEGSVTSETPIYISLEASDIGGASDSEICISWLTSTSADSDFRSWNAATAAFCDVPWYPSTAQLPAVQTTYQPPCFWMSNDGRFVQGMSARLTDFFFPSSDSSPASGTAAQWSEFPDTLCQAPARQQFYNTLGGCMPFYPSGLDIVNHKNLTTGFDLDFEAVQSSYTLSCSAGPNGVPLSADVPFNDCISLDPNVPAVCSAAIATNADFTLPASITSQLKSDLTFGLGGGGGSPAPVTAQGVGNFGGQIGEIPNSAAATELGVGNFGGVVGEIPATPTAADTEESSTALDDIPTGPSIVVTTQAADSPEVSGLALGEMLGSELRAEQSTEGGAQVRARRSARLQQRASASLEHDKHLLATHTAALANDTPTITAAPSRPPQPKNRERGGVPKKSPTKRMEPVLNRRIEKRGEEPHQWCKEGQLVVSEYAGHSALEVCQSSSSWGPDFVSITEGIFCDMCERQSYPLCGQGSTAPGGSGVCFDLDTKQLRALANSRYRRDGKRIPVKRYDGVRHWK